MWKNMVFILLIFLQRLPQAQGCNYELLEMRACSFSQRILEKVFSSKSSIENSLDFLWALDEDGLVEERYRKKEFLNSLKDKNEKISQENSFFKDFYNNCKNILNETKDDDNIQIVSLSMLLESVTQKVVESYAHLERSRSLVKKAKEEQVKQTRTLAIKQEAESLITSLLTEQSDLRNAVRLFKLFYNNRELLKEQIEKSEEGIFEYMTSSLTSSIELLSSEDTLKYLKLYAYKYGTPGQKARLANKDEYETVTKLLKNAGTKGEEFAYKYIDLGTLETTKISSEKGTAISTSLLSNFKPSIKEKLELEEDTSEGSYFKGQEEKHASPNIGRHNSSYIE